MASPVEAHYYHRKLTLSSSEETLISGRRDGLAGRSFLYLLEEAIMASTEKDLCTHLKKRWPQRKKLSTPTRRSGGLTGRSFLCPLEEAVASPEEAFCTH
jgi:hypothetical protein